MPRALPTVRAALALATALLVAAPATGQPAKTLDFHDSHFHLTNYVQKGISLQELLALMGKRVGRSTLFGIPLQQQWSHRVSGDFAPTYYLETDSPLYYYSLTDAFIAHSFLKLPPKDRARFDPMITGFNPTDMYAVDHIRRVLEMYPGVFSGVGEFTIHKEFVSSKVAGEVASLRDVALDRILDFAGEVGLVVLLHNDATTPFKKEGTPHVYLDQLRELFRRHPKTTIIWAHVGLGRVIQPIEGHAAMIASFADDPELQHVLFDLSWDETAKYVVQSPESVRITADLIESHPDRFLFGTDVVAPTSAEQYRQTFELYAPLWKALSAEASEKVRVRNYERVFDAARRRVRAWERANLPGAR